MLRSNKGIAKTLKTLCLSDNCLCEPYRNRNEDRPFEWQFPPNAYDRSQISENTEVLARVQVPGVGNRIVWEWHHGIVTDCKASIKKGTCEFTINFDDNRTQQMVNRASNLLWAQLLAREKAEHKAKVKEADLKGMPAPTAKYPKNKPAVYISDENVKIIQESAAMAAIAELLKHGIPPPATAEELWQASQEKQAKLKELRLKSDDKKEKQKKSGNLDTSSKISKKSKDSKNSKKSKSSKSSKNKSFQSQQSPDSASSQEQATVAVKISSTVDKDLFGFGDKSLASTASSWHISEGLESLETNGGQDDQSTIKTYKNTNTTATVDKEGNREGGGDSLINNSRNFPDDLLAFEAEAENNLKMYLQIEDADAESGDAPKSIKLDIDSDLFSAESQSDDDKEDDDSDEGDNGDDDDDSDNDSIGSDNSQDLPLPSWAKDTGGPYGSMQVGLQRLELKRCNIDDAGVVALSKGLEHPACPISALFLDGNYFGGESGAMGLSNALDLNRSLTYLGLVGCELSMHVRREWAHALNSNSKSRLSSIAMDAFCIEPRPLKKQYDPLTHNRLHRASILHGHVKLNASFASKKLKAVVTGKAHEVDNQALEDNQLVRFEGGAKGLLEHKQKKKQALLMRLGINADGNEPVVNSGFDKWKCKEYEEIISRSVGSSDVGMLATVLARNRDVTGLNLSGSSFDMEAFQVLADSLSVRSRLPSPPARRVTDEEYEDDAHSPSYKRRQKNPLSGNGGFSNFITNKAISPLPSPATKQATLKFSNVQTFGSSNSSPPSPAPLLSSPLKSSSYKKAWLSALSLAKIHLGSEGAAILTDVLADLPSLKYLCLRGCNLTDYGSNILAANNLISALEGTFQSVAPAAPKPPKFGKRSERTSDNDSVGSAATASTNGTKSGGSDLVGAKSSSSASKSLGGAPSIKKSFSIKTSSNNSNQPVELSTVYYQHPPNKSLAGKSSAFWKVPVEPPSENWGKAPPLRFLDISDNGLPATLVWRCVLYMKNHMSTMKWMDLSGNMIYDLIPTSLEMEPMSWASHLSPPFQYDLTLPMRQEILFSGEAIEWVIQPHSSQAGEASCGSGSFNTTGNPVISTESKLTDEAYGEALNALAEKACHHGAPPLFLVTGKAAVEAKVEAVLEDRPEAYVAAREELRNSAWRQQRLLDLVVEIDAAKENVRRVFQRHALLDKRKEKKLRQQEEEARVAKEKMEFERARLCEKDERRSMHESELEMKKFLLHEYKLKIESERLERELNLALSEYNLMAKEDEDVNGYIEVEEDSTRCKVRKAYFAVSGAKENFQLPWSSFKTFLTAMNCNGFDDEKCENVTKIYFGNQKRSAFFYVYDATDLLKISELASTFYEVDIDNSGGISADELSLCLAKLNFEMPPEKCIELLKSIDANNDGIVSLEEFVIFFRYVKLETRLAAETKVIQANHGKRKQLNLTQKLGMVVNPDGVVSKVIPNGQADVELGITVGCKIVNCNDDIVSSLEELKASIAKAKSQEKQECEIIFVNPKEAVYARHALAKLRAESSRKTALAAEAAAKQAEMRKIMAEKNAKLLQQINQESRVKAELEQRQLKERLRRERETSLLEAEKKRIAFETELKQRDKVYKAEQLRIQQEELRIKKELQEIEENEQREKFKRETAELAANSQLGKLRNEQDELMQEGEKAAAKAAARWGKEDAGHPNSMLNKPKRRRHRLRYVMAAVPQQRSEKQLFRFAMALIYIHDTKKTGPGQSNAGRGGGKRDADGKKVNRSTDVKNMTCELRCLRAWARASLSEKPQLLQDLRHVLITRLKRSDVATWIRELLFRKSPKPKIPIEHEDGSYLVFDERIGWIVRLELKTAPCNCSACQDHSMEFPKRSSNFVLPNVEGLLPEPTY